MVDIVKVGLKVIQDEIKALEMVKKKIGPHFEKAVKLIYNSKGKVIVTGMGKSGIIAKKIAATLTSTGTPAFYLNPAEGSHGDLGNILRDDVVIALSKSGETDEIVRILPYLKRFNISLISITSRPHAVISKNSNVVLNMGVENEACPLNLAPTCSSTAQLVIGDAIAVALLKLKKFTKEDFALFHPGGLLSKKLLKVKDLMHIGNQLPLVNERATMRDVIHTIIDKRFGVAIIVDGQKKLKGVIVDGDLKRILLKTENIMDKKASEFMTKEPKTISEDEFVARALQIMEGKITSLLIINEEDQPKGLLHIHDILKAGIY
ncbi:MAG: KpsF/GutQ family sugar-phosphate isomerase [Spirochaetes bacterium]|nr:KpsF/GutQ family sugar-phosphate isomerase [Spirochaetota bacterium]